MQDNSQLSTLNSQLVLLAALFLTSCTGYERENFRMEVGKEYALKRWPDSAYIDTLERFFAKEYVKERKQKAEITMNMGNNVMSLPKKDEKKPGKAAEKKSQSKPAESIGSFPDRFFHALYTLSENPGNAEHGRKYKAKGGENLDDLLLRIYGAQVKRVPKNLSENMIKRLNPGVDVSSFAEGEMVLLPNVK
ncbi:MAG: hypothetical protein FWC26_08425 [Fibromonadales bacterium]|nr:hypothetical protein [Fibromonadales bacterium]